ncbi:MAG: pyruvate kinase [Meiothermus sp.]|nr:pyruvate kinase [Meiothermus sp.]MDT7920655.1 pyruvate kinase [Meiothermus sp.]
MARSTWKCQLLEAVALLDELLSRMQAYQHKKTPRLRALYSWQ